MALKGLARDRQADTGHAIGGFSRHAAQFRHAFAAGVLTALLQIGGSILWRRNTGFYRQYRMPGQRRRHRLGVSPQVTAQRHTASQQRQTSFGDVHVMVPFLLLSPRSKSNVTIGSRNDRNIIRRTLAGSCADGSTR
ncbi:hypothetical protein D3C72_1777500 [compost metagenome]